MYSKFLCCHFLCTVSVSFNRLASWSSTRRWKPVIQVSNFNIWFDVGLWFVTATLRAHHRGSRVKMTTNLRICDNSFTEPHFIFMSNPRVIDFDNERNEMSSNWGRQRALRLECAEAARQTRLRNVWIYRCAWVCVCQQYIVKCHFNMFTGSLIGTKTRPSVSLCMWLVSITRSTHDLRFIFTSLRSSVAPTQYCA